MISYEPLWDTMRQKKASTYTLQTKGNISSSTIRRMKAGESISTHTLDSLCKLFDCPIDKIIEYIPDSQ